MSKERRLPLRGRFARFTFLALGLLALLFAATLRESQPVSARIFGVSIVDPAAPGFKNGDYDLSDAQVFPLGQSDGFPGNRGLQIDTYFAPVGSVVWLGIAAENGNGVVTVDSDDYGTFVKALCNDRDGDARDFEDPDDTCLGVNGIGTDRLTINDQGNQFDHVPLISIPRLGLAVGFKCGSTPGTARMLVAQGSFLFRFFIVCHGPVTTAQLSASATRLEVVPMPGSTAHSLIRLDLKDVYGGIVAGYEVQWSVDRCAIETDEVDNIDEALAAMNGFLDLTTSVAPDGVSQSDAVRNLVYDFNNDGVLEAISLAVLHCEPGHSPSSAPGPINIQARIFKTGETPVIVTMTLNLIGPPAQIFLQASPTRVVCGEKVTLNAVVVDSLGQPVSDNTPIEFVTNFGGTSATGFLLGPVAPLSSNVAFTHNGVVQSFILTSQVNVGVYHIVAQADAIFSTPPVTQSVDVSCFVPTPTPRPTAAPAATTVAPATTGIRPPSTGDAGLR